MFRSKTQNINSDAENQINGTEANSKDYKNISENTEIISNKNTYKRKNNNLHFTQINSNIQTKYKSRTYILKNEKDIEILSHLSKILF